MNIGKIKCSDITYIVNIYDLLKVVGAWIKDLFELPSRDSVCTFSFDSDAL